MKAQLSLTNPRDAKACLKLLQFDVLTTLSLTILAYLQFFIRLPVVASEIFEIPRNSLKIQTYRVQGHRSLCQSKAHMRLSSSQSLIVTLAVSATVFEILTLKARKSLIFSTQPFFEAPARGNPLEFCDEIWHQKTRIVGLAGSEEIMTLAFVILPQYRRVTNGGTDRETDTLRSLLPARVKSHCAGNEQVKKRKRVRNWKEKERGREGGI